MLNRPNMRIRVRYDPPWRFGERHRRYYVFTPPRWLQAWWDLVHPTVATFAYVRLLVATCVGTFVSVIWTAVCVAVGLYVLVWWCLPIVLETLF